MKIKKHRRNCRKSQKMNVMTGRTFHVAGIIVILLFAVVMNLVAESRCKAVNDSICEKEKLLARLEQDRDREDAVWQQMTSEENLSRALVRHGLNMRTPKDEQVIRLDANGVVRPGQRSVELARARLANPGVVASASRSRTRRGR